MKPILLHPSLHKQSSLRLLFLLTLLSLFFILSLITTTTNHPDSTPPSPPLLKPVLTALLHYAATSRFSYTALRSISATILRHNRPLNLLVFGLSHETLLWKTLNPKGRTVFIDESSFLVSKLEEKHPEIEAYDVQYFSPKKPRKLKNLIEYAKKRSRKECRPVQNLLYSECQLAITGFPNFVYDVAWDVILVNGSAAGRAAEIFTASVLVRRGRERERGRGDGTHVFVHELEREVERVCSGEFLCGENFVEEKGDLGHFFVLGENMGEGEFGFCKNNTLETLSRTSLGYEHVYI